MITDACPAITQHELVILRHILEHFTWEQIDMMARECDRCKELSPFWELKVLFEKNQAHFIRSAPSLEMPKTEK